MEPAVGVAVFWLLFGGTHVGLATVSLRRALVARLGELGFIAVYSVIAGAAFAGLVTYYAAHQFAGAAGFAAGEHVLVRGILIVAIVVGFTLALASLWSYPTSTYAIGTERTREPRGLERITRHPFFAGIALAATAHALLATRLTGTVFFAGLALLAVIGSAHQDRKLLALRGAHYARYLAVTSAIPFAAVLSGRQRLVRSEIRWAAVAVALLLAYVLRTVHPSIFARGGLWVIVAVIGGAAVLGLQSWFQIARRGRRTAPATSH